MNEDRPIEEDIKREDSTPSILDQAKSQEWDAGYYDFGKLEHDGNDYFNPSLVQREDGPWLLVRRSEPHPQGFRFGQNFVFAFMLDKDGKTPKMGVRLRWIGGDGSQHYEDPRGFYHPRLEQTFIGCCTFMWYPDQTWTGAHQVLGAFDNDWTCRKVDYPQVGGNPGRMQKIADRNRYEKNWLWFLHEDEQLHLLYKARPWLMLGFGERWSDRKEYKHEGVSWGYGDIRGGTSPVKVGDYYFTFHHSSLPWKGRYRRYYAGALAFDANPPFHPKLITRQPLLQGSQNDHWTQRKPLVVFPCGALNRNGNWLISMGVNDLKSAWLELPHDALMERMEPIDNVDAPIMSRPGLSRKEEIAAQRRKNLAKARAVRAAKRKPR